MSKSLSVALLISIAFVQVATANNEIAPKEWGSKIPWQTCGEVFSRPALESAAFLSDGDLRTAATFTRGVENAGELTVRFRKPVDVTMFRFAQHWLKANSVRLWAAVDNPSNMVVAAEWKDDKPADNVWIEMPVNRKVHALKFQPLSGTIAYRSVYPVISEIEIYSKERVHGGLPRTSGPRLVTADILPVPDLTKTKFDFRVCTDWWNYGMEQWESKRKEVPGLGNWGPFKDTLAQLKDLGVTSVRMFAESEAFTGDKGGYSSFPLEGLPADQQFDWLKPWSEEMHRAGYKVYYFSHAWRVPVQRAGKQAEGVWKRWDWPYMASDALVGVNEHYSETYPCLLCEDRFRTEWTKILRGALKSGVDGVYVMPDEYYFKGHNLSRTDCKACRAEFEKMFGFDSLPKLKPAPVANNAQGQVMPPIPVDTEQYRKWKVFEYRKLEELFTGIADGLRKEFPKAKFVFSDNQAAGLTGNCFLECTVANDILGASKAYDFKQVYGSGSAPADKWLKSIMFMKHFTAASGEERVLSSSGWGSASVYAPAETYNAILPDVMLGAKALEVYRLNYMYRNGGISVYRKLFRMVRLLEKWGIFETRTPEDVGFVYSRASSDWWFVKANALIDPSAERSATDFNLYLADGDQSINRLGAGGESEERTRFLAQERVRGFGAQYTVESMLAANAFAYTLVYAERPDLMKNLKRFKTLVVPFAYSLSDEAIVEIAAAAGAGTKVLIFGPLAPTDEYGCARNGEALRSLLGKDNVVHIEGNAGDVSGDLKKIAKWADTVAANTSDAVRFHANGSPVSCIVREMKDSSGYIVYICNAAMRPEGGKSPEPSEVAVSLPVKDGRYSIETYSSDDCEVRRGMIGGDGKIAAEKLNRFTVRILPQEVILLKITR